MWEGLVFAPLRFRERRVGGRVGRRVVSSSEWRRRWRDGSAARFR